MRKTYGQIQLTDSDFDTLVTAVKSAGVRSKKLKMDGIKVIVNKMGANRDLFVQQGDPEEPDCLFTRLGKIEGLSKAT
jgi:hypothetical protein